MCSKRAFDPTICVLNDLDASGKTPENNPPEMTATLNALLKAKGEPITAIIAVNDWTAHGLYSAAANLGRSIGDEISMVGFDNSVAICTSLRPQLTSFSIPLGDVAYAAAIKLFERIAAPSAIWDNSLHLIRGEIVERDSVKILSGDKQLG